MSRVAVLMGGQSAEREISLRSGEGVLRALQAKGVDALGFDPAERPLQELLNEGVTTAFIALHGRYGEDGCVQGALELLGIAYTGSGVMASALAMDKLITNRVWMTHGIPTPAFAQASEASTAELVRALGLPLAVKPLREGSSLGFTKIESESQLSDAIAKARHFDDAVVVEAFITGREFTVALLQEPGGPVRALDVIEIVAPKGNYDYQNKYFGNATRYECPAAISSEMAGLMKALSCKAFEALGCEGWARVDILWDDQTPNAQPQLLELNTSPGMTDHSLVPMAARESGLGYEDLVLAILKTARLKQSALPALGKEALA
ncbi:MAG: D-alanine--D-alanine ligase [Burkholderiaceae bacterium]